jgi:outer membrane protein assembly factor BamB
VWLFDKTGKVRWELDTGMGGPIDIRLLPNGRFLIAEHSANRVTERDSKGKIVWEKKVASQPVACQRLPNGNTFIATYNQLLEITRDGKEVFSFSKPANIYYAQKLRNGHIVYAHNSGKVVEVDASGKEVCSLSLGGMSGWGGVEKLPNGNYLVALSTAGKVVEVDKTGKTLWSYAMKSPSLATRLPNGNILVSSHYGKILVEINRAGREVWKQTVVGRPFKVRRY